MSAAPANDNADLLEANDERMGPNEDPAPASVAPFAPIAEPRIEPRPHVLLFADKVVVQHTLGKYEEVEAPLLALSFDYEHQRVRANDLSEHIFLASEMGIEAVPRHRQAERQARFVIESFGVSDLECMEDLGCPPDCDADYLVSADPDAHTRCSFTAYVLPQLEQLGWKVEIDKDYPYQVVRDDEAPWYADVSPSEERPDWFGLELGVEIDGKRINLLPTLLEFLDATRKGRSLEDLARSKKVIAVKVSDTHHLAVPHDRFRAVMQAVVELYDGRDAATLRFPIEDATALDRLEIAFDESDGPLLTWDDPEEVRKTIKPRARTKAEPVPENPTPGLRATLRGYQCEGVGWLQHLREHDLGGVLADDMGLGKTLQTIACLAMEKDAGRADLPSMIVAPTSLVQNWVREFQKFAPHITTHAWHGGKRWATQSRLGTSDIIVTSYPILIRDLALFSEMPLHYVVLDEAQTIKNARSRANAACCALDARHRLCLSGTPIENHLGELWSLFRFASPDLLGSELTFKERYRTPIERYADNDRLAMLRDRVSPQILRRLKRDVAKELPPKTELVRPIEISGKQRDLYESIRMGAHQKVRQMISKKGFAASTITILDALTKLRQVCCDPRLVRMDAARFVRKSAKFEELMTLLETQLSQGHRALIFSQFTSMLRLISQGLSERRIKHLTLTGASKDRQGLCDRFERGDADVFLISLKAGGTGLNLTSADTVIHYDPWWNPTTQAQATDRAYRIGQKRPVFVHNLIIAGSVEERMLLLQRKKRALAEGVLGGESGGAKLQEDDVDLLFAPLY